MRGTAVRRLRESKVSCAGQQSGACGRVSIGEVQRVAWQEFRNRREGALAGLNPPPYQSGDSLREQGSGNAGSRLVRRLAVESAWSRLRHQPGRASSRWYEERFGLGSARQRKVGIVALARTLLIALWRYPACLARDS